VRGGQGGRGRAGDIERMGGEKKLLGFVTGVSGKGRNLQSNEGGGVRGVVGKGVILRSGRNEMNEEILIAGARCWVN